MVPEEDFSKSKAAGGKGDGRGAPARPSPSFSCRSRCCICLTAIMQLRAPMPPLLLLLSACTYRTCVFTWPCACGISEPSLLMLSVRVFE